MSHKMQGSPSRITSGPSGKYPNALEATTAFTKHQQVRYQLAVDNFQKGNGPQVFNTSGGLSEISTDAGQQQHQATIVNTQNFDQVRYQQQLITSGHLKNQTTNNTPPELQKAVSTASVASTNEGGNSVFGALSDLEEESQEAVSAQRDETNKLMDALKLEEVCRKEHFRYLNDISSDYDLGNDVVPSGNGKPSSTKSVLFAKQRGTNIPVVIKMRNKQRSFKDEQEISEWVMNMKVLHKLRLTDLPHVAKVHDIVEDKDSYYCVMEHVKGRDLFDYFVQEKIYEKSYKLQVVRQMAHDIVESLGELHSVGLIHKDIKLENIVLDEDRQKQTGPNLICKCKIVDFDTVDIYRPRRRNFHVLGTDQYIAPETYAGYSTPASDMWAVGVIFYTILVGSFPFHGSLFDDKPGENYVGHARMDQIRKRLRIGRIDWNNKVWAAEPKAHDFVKRCFECEQYKRLTVKQALEHPWIRDLHDPNKSVLKF